MPDLSASRGSEENVIAPSGFAADRYAFADGQTNKIMLPPGLLRVQCSSIISSRLTDIGAWQDQDSKGDRQRQGGPSAARYMVLRAGDDIFRCGWSGGTEFSAADVPGGTDSGGPIIV